MIKQGQTYKTVGGWKVRIIWICADDLQKGFYAIHRPNTDDESTPIYHWGDGTAHSTLSVNAPPRFGKPHPADILLKELE